jgi:hypothetical protein
MATKKYITCDTCNKVITDPDDGLVIIGNIGVAVPAPDFKGLIGNAFPEPDQHGLIRVADIKSYDYCKQCFCTILNIDINSLPFRGNIDE